ncbi:MAG: DEAD/DEAH box helicase family protein [Lachnospiraceae bacterium]|nr:DEAD/DEAH box helicase family protein [Lachnospiraceae bacterium]
MSNFKFLQDKKEYTLFANAAIEAEKIYHSSPAMCAVGCRKALELAVKWVYSADNSIKMPYKNNLQSLIHEQMFRFALEQNTWRKLPYIAKLGNLAVHTERNIQAGDALASMRGLFEFIEWVDYCYGMDYEERKFDEAAIPQEKVAVDTKKIKEQESLLGEKDAEIEKLRRQVEEMSERLTAQKDSHRKSRKFVAEDITEWETRKRYIDVDLQDLGWKLTGDDSDVWEEYPVNDMMGVPGKKGSVDYVLFGKDGLPLAVIEAKRTSKDPNSGRKQAMLYADCLERKLGRRPMMFTSNGFETYFWDDKLSPQRRVSGVFSKGDLQKLMNRRSEKKDLLSVKIDDKMTDRYYQKEAIRAVCENVKEGYRKNLLVMATGTGKTRTAASLTDVFSRAGYVTNVLFLADRTALVKQAKDDFKNYLPDLSLCNLCTDKDDKNARIVFSTYPTMLNALDSARNPEGKRLFTPTHFDMIIIDESHRSIFKKYRVIFEYFDAILVGLTATPKMDVDRNTYDFFEMESGVPTYAYDYETAVYADHMLVPYYTYLVKTEFLNDGIVYEKLSQSDKERYEEDFIEDEGLPESIPSSALNDFVFNELTVDKVLQDLMGKGIKTAGGDRLGKTIIFAQNKKHAEFILERFNKLYPKYHGTFAQRVICNDAYAQTTIDDFKKPEGEPHIVVSVDMMDTGIDVPECVNLVFFKKVRSKTKFWQMIGRGTRLSEDLDCVDLIDGEYIGKRRFLIFDYCNNFEFFGEKPNGYEGHEAKTLQENIFGKRVRLIAALQEGAFADEEYQTWRQELAEICHAQIMELNGELIAVKMKRQYVEKYKDEKKFEYVNQGDKGELIKEIAPIVTMNDMEEAAKRFDNFIYGMILTKIEGKPAFRYAKKQLCGIADALESKISIPQIQEKRSLIKEINTDAFWASDNILILEEVRKELRGLMKFLVESGRKKESIFTRLTDPVMEEQEGVQLAAAYDFEDYRKKVNQYVEEHKGSLAIYKLMHNNPLSEGDYKELERVLTEELGSREDYKRTFGDTPFGLLVRKIAKLDHEAAMEAFSAFIDDASLNQRQIQFIYKIINHVEQNGYMEDIMELQRPPFDKPVPFIKMFDAKTRNSLLQKINEIKENAVNVTA